MIRFIFLLAALSVSLNALDHKADLSLKHVSYDNYHNEVLLQGDLKLGFKKNLFEATVAAEYLYSTQYKERCYLLLNELYFTKEFEHYSVLLGKSVKFWGEMEGFNITDIYNQKNYLLDPFSKSAKLGSIGFNVTRYIDEKSLEFGMKFYEEDVDYPLFDMPYYPFPVGYDNKLHLSDDRYTPSLYLSYGFSTDDVVDSESKVILYHGYDNKRYFIPTNATTLSQYAYRVDKLLLLSHIVYQDMIFKCEGVYTNVRVDEAISDYLQYTVGMEKSFYDLFNSDVTLYLEYYGYQYMDEGKIQQVDVSEIYDHDLFLALRIDLNDVRNSEIKAGMLYDTEIDEKVFKVEAKTRVLDGLVLNAEILHTITADNTLLDQLGETTRVTAGITYTF
jgi:hypothetical protein